MPLQPEDIAAYGAIWRQRWEATLVACRRLGGTPKGFRLALSEDNNDEVVQIETDFILAPPATESDVLFVEEILTRPIPPEFRKVLTQFSAEVNLGWRIPVLFNTPAILREVNRGDSHWSLEGIIEAVEMWNSCFREFSNENLFAFTTLHNGDLLAIRESDTEGNAPVIYIDHEYGPYHLWTLGNSFVDFLNRWTQIGCAGPDWRIIEPFLESKTAGIVADSENARLWRKAFRNNDS